MSYIRFENIVKSFGSNTVLKDINLEVEKGQLLVSGVLLITDDGGTVVNRQKVRADAVRVHCFDVCPVLRQ